MPSRDWRLRLQDILQSITGIEQRTAHITFEEFQNNETLVKAVLYDFVVIGEATRTVSDEIQNRYPDIPWRLMAGMRNIVTHEYFQIDLARVWETIQDDLPRLVSQLQDVLEWETREE
ncbi:HepT-like ribonuclease domain-containing protein [Coleofasciculus sp.]|uniref:HepT-like ribonuclease domain-containing protein n=1 Tax=Coleofasciculus sp. TaxID=3100458 RepID=UPI0039FB0B9A